MFKNNFLKGALIFSSLWVTQVLAVAIIPATGQQQMHLNNGVLKGKAPLAGGLFTLSDMTYKGGFNLETGIYGTKPSHDTAYSSAVFTLGVGGSSIYVTGNAQGSGVGEYQVPELVNSTDVSSFNRGARKQPFTDINGTARVDTGITENFELTGMQVIGSKLIINYFSWYDTIGAPETTVVFDDASNLAGSNVRGPFEVNGKAHASGWLTPIPDEYQASLGGTYISGWSDGSIISRLSVGTSGFIQNPELDLLTASVGGAVAAHPVLDFPYANESILYSKSQNPVGVTDMDAILYNNAKNNDLWNITSSNNYGFIIPNTKTYMAIGRSSGHVDGLGYKITQDNGNVCGGPCPYSVDDDYAYYWLWNVDDLISAKNGTTTTYDARPYEYGKLNLPNGLKNIGGASYNNNTGELIISVVNADGINPAFFVYQIGG